MTDMQTQIGAMLEEYRAMQSRIGELRTTVASVTTTVRSPDRSVTVTVDGQGELRDLRIDLVLGARLDARALAWRILTASRIAAAQARERVRLAVHEALPERMRELVAADGSIDLTPVLPVDLDTPAHGLGRRT